MFSHVYENKNISREEDSRYHHSAIFQISTEAELPNDIIIISGQINTEIQIS